MVISEKKIGFEKFELSKDEQGSLGDRAFIPCPLSLSVQARGDLSEDTGEGMCALNRMLNQLPCKAP